MKKIFVLLAFIGLGQASAATPECKAICQGMRSGWGYQACLQQCQQIKIQRSTNGVCFKNFVVTGTGVNTHAAATSAEARANEACGTDDHNWSSRLSDYSFEQISHEEFSATANFQCCSSW